MSVHEPRHEPPKCRHLLPWLRRLPRLGQQLPFKASPHRFAPDFDDTGARLRPRRSDPSGRTTWMSASQPPRRYRLIFTLIALYSFGDGARLRSSQCNNSSLRRSTRRPTRVTPGSCPRANIEYTAFLVVRSTSAVSSTVSNSRIEVGVFVTAPSSSSARALAASRRGSLVWLGNAPPARSCRRGTEQRGQRICCNGRTARRDEKGGGVFPP